MSTNNKSIVCDELDRSGNVRILIELAENLRNNASAMELLRDQLRLVCD